MALELTPLKMERAVFTTAVVPGEDGPNGSDDVSFQVATNPGAPSGVVTLQDRERVDEIARMLAGENISEAARSAAKVLLDG